MTTFIFDRARWMQDMDGTWLSLHVPPALAREFCESMKPDKAYDAELKEHREKRSLDANAYAWVLIGKLSASLRITPDDVYRQYIPNIGENYEVVPVKEDLIDRWDKLWCSGHIGRMTDDLGPCRNTQGYHNIRSYIGSSDYDTAQMSRLIELIVQDCKDQGIETMTPIELARLTEAWHG